MKNLLRIYLMFCLMLLISCASTSETVIQKDITSIRNVELYLVNSSGIMILNYNDAYKMNMASFEDVQQQAVQALEMMQFELLSIGLNIVDKNNHADAKFEFSIGNIRYDPLVGYIADRAIIRIIDNKNQIIAIFKAETEFITPSIKNLIDTLGEELKKHIIESK